MAAERSPSSVLLLHRAERSAGRAGAQALPDGYQDELVLEAAAQVPHQGDDYPPAPAAWDASDVVRRDAAEDARHQRPAQLDAGAEKSADRARDARALDAQFRLKERWIAILAAQAAVAEPCRPDVVPSAEQSCAAREAVALPLLEAP